MHEQQQRAEYTAAADLPPTAVEGSAPQSRRASVEAALDAFSGWSQSIVSLTRRVCPYSTSFTLEELDVVLADGTRLELICKNLGWDDLLPEARRVRPHFLHAPLREIRMYEHALSTGEFDTPACYGASSDPESDRYVLLLERVPSRKLCHVGDFGVWLQTARWLGAAHARFAKRTAVLRKHVPLVDYDDAYYHTWLRRASANVRKMSDAGSRPRADIEFVAGLYPDVVRRLVRLPRTIIHGEFYASNVLVRQPGRGDDHRTRPRICPVDWEMAAHAPGLIDLAALVSGHWTAEQRETMAMAYYECLVDHRAEVPPMADFLRALEYCRLHLAVQWIGWCPDWSPPDDQARDWLREAVQVARGLAS